MATKRITLFSPQFSRIKSFSGMGFSETSAKTNVITASIKNQAASQGIDKSIYAILTVDRWESLNQMEYKLASLRPVHGRLALKFFKWFIKQPGIYQKWVLGQNLFLLHLWILIPSAIRTLQFLMF
nr:pentatricopeptide repeat-containing protein At5g55840 isoform X1 [Ipomoea trifida]